jgi:hypothetical protein
MLPYAGMLHNMCYVDRPRRGVYDPRARHTHTPEDKVSEWEVAVDENPSTVIFDTIGDQFIGTFERAQMIELPDSGGEEFCQLQFRNADGFFGINAGYKLSQAFSKIDPGTMCRITYVKDIDTGQPSPMKDFRVEVSR